MRRLLSVPGLCFCLSIVTAQAEEIPPTGPAIAYEPAFPAQAGFDRPLFVAYTETDPEMAYVVTQPGYVYRVHRSGTTAERSVFLDLSARVFLDNWEEGLLGFQFDPNYAKNGYVYVYYSERIATREGTMGNGKRVKSNRQSIVARYATKRGAAPVVDDSSELRLLEVFQPFGNHNGGTILFGPDRMLYVALGDGGAANDPYTNAQSKQVLLGKVLRVDAAAATAEKPYRIPADNPFVAEEGARGEIWCYGLRNPWRITFDRTTGDLWCGDVGQNLIEEVDRLEKGGNYGWNALEANDPFTLPKVPTPVPADTKAPIAEYRHPEGLSITGGHVYRGSKIPGLQGFFVYADFMTMRAWAVREGKQGKAHEVVTLARLPKQPSSFAEQPDGELLVTCFSGKDGAIYRIVPAAK